MWVWNDYLLPYLVLDGTKYMTIPILIQYFRLSLIHICLDIVIGNGLQASNVYDHHVADLLPAHQDDRVRH